MSATLPADLVAALVRLARKGAYAIVCDSAAAAQAPFAIYSPRNAFARPIAMLPAYVVKSALVAGLLVPVSGGCTDGRVELSRLGRAAVRRALLVGTASAAAAPASPRVVAAPAVAVQRIEGPLAWLRRRRDKEGRALISEPQFDAGERLAADFHRARMLPRVTASWSPVAARGRAANAACVGDISDGALAARERLHRALSAAGPELASLLIDVCCRDIGLEAAERVRGWPKRSGKIVLDMGLTALARHYGLVPARADGARADIRQWGEPGVQADLAAWDEGGA